MSDSRPLILSILDPAPAIGLGVIQKLAEIMPEVRLRYLHTSQGQEARILALGDEAVMVTPLNDLQELAGSRAIFPCTRPAPPWDELLLEWLRAHPDIHLVDLSQPGFAGPEAVSCRRPIAPLPQWLHLPHPALAGPLAVLDTLIPVEPLDVHITLMLPCSSFGEVGILDLAAQGRARLTGAPPPAPEVLPEVLAFDLAPAPAASRKELARQFSELQPGITAHIQAVHTGVFFGHAATLSIRCARPTSAARVRELLRLHGGVRLTRNIGPARPSQVAEQSKVVCAELVIDGTWVSLWVAADGDQLYGPELIAEVLAALTKV